MARHTLTTVAFSIVAALFLVVDVSRASSQGFSRSGFGYGYSVPMYNTRFGAGYGMGYVYDPYATGSFEPPDLLNAPMFRAQHKFDSHYPGRYSHHRPLEFKESVTHQPHHVPQRRHRSTTHYYRGW
ncbi:hypothetical protein [Aporhodopirellula aestuarii]|uniref:Secreted protein n=1 Tax=Aporhodopirellula aestuarii TaxID=2950107 RepID=A0ABT0U8L7_9BACT|nr:hypothetical protein [Aporhodopirellula aestuarii]MCM2373157.1 hypothetical protein [Aporhodopirellula aestuarii]